MSVVVLWEEVRVPWMSLPEVGTERNWYGAMMDPMQMEALMERIRDHAQIWGLSRMSAIT